MRLKLNTKFAEPLFLFWRQIAFDGTQEKLMAHLMKIGVRVKAINRQVQTFHCVGNPSAPTFERLLDRNQLIGERESRNRTAFINRKNNFPSFGIKHDWRGKGATDLSVIGSALMQGVAFAPRFTRKRRRLVPPNTPGDVWAIAKALSHHRASAMCARVLYLSPSGDRKAHELRA